MGQRTTWAGYPRTGAIADLVPATGDPFSTKRFAFARIDVFADYVNVVWAGKQLDSVWVASVPRQYKGGFKALHFGNAGCVQPAYPFYLDSITLNGGIFTTGLDPTGACCLDDGNCIEVPTANDCPGWKFTPWRSCSEDLICCPVPFADADRDGDVDHDDFGAWQVCYTGLGAGVPTGCECFNRDKDTDIDAADFAAFSDCYSGPNVPWSQALTPSCKP